MIPQKPTNWSHGERGSIVRIDQVTDREWRAFLRWFEANEERIRQITETQDEVRP